MGENEDHIVEFKAAYAIDIAEFALLTKEDDHFQMAREALGL
ncbi:hypothetical protein [Metabacillus idriensis]